MTFQLPRRVHIGPGCHVYAYIPSIALWMSHPFSVAWVEPISCVTRLPLPESSFERRRVESMSSRLEKQDFVDLDRPHDNKQP
ncbi:hypothetical protein, partial [Isoptericola croceus]|uniref:hypothetical protein n=1 Tax=Isoptericola croceus TaxID=3031406 RepID=UPI0034D54DE6